MLPASWPKARRHSAGRPASARIEQKTPPTTPRAPATPTVGHPFMQRPYPMARNLRHARGLMPERHGFPAGVPAWIDSAQPDVDAAIAFYGGLFGWQFADRAPSDSDERYVVADHGRQDGRSDRIAVRRGPPVVARLVVRTSRSTVRRASPRASAMPAGAWSLHRPTGSASRRPRSVPIPAAPPSACGSPARSAVPDRSMRPARGTSASSIPMTSRTRRASTHRSSAGR